MFRNYSRIQKLIAIALTPLLCGTQSFAQNAPAWPSKPMQIIVAFAAGGPVDRMARIIAPVLQKYLEVPVIVENKVGASGIIAQQYVMNSKDEHMFLLHTTGGHTVRPHTKTMNFDPWQTLRPVAAVASIPTLFVGSPKNPARNLPDIIKYAREKPGKLNFAVIGLGTTNHLAGEMLKDHEGITSTNVPYTSWSQMLPDMIAGQVDIVNVYLPISAPQIQAGKLVAYAIATEKRSKYLPDVPTTVELGMPEVLNSDIYAIFVPAALASERVNKLQQAVALALKDKVVQESFIAAMFETENKTPNQLLKTMQDEEIRLLPAIKAHNIRME